MNLSRFSIRHPVTTVMLMLIMILLGAVSLLNTPVDLLPKINPPVLGIMTGFSGASPQEVDTLVTQPVESAVSTVQGVTNIMSISSEHFSLVVAEFSWGADLNEARNDISQALDQATLPEGAARSSIIKFDPTLLPVMQLSITSDALDLDSLSHLVRTEIAPLIDNVEGVGAVGVTGGTRQEVQVLVDPDLLAEYQLSLMQVTNAIQGSQLGMPAGSVGEGDRSLGVRVVTDADNLDALANLVITFLPPEEDEPSGSSPFSNLPGLPDGLGGLLSSGLMGDLSSLGSLMQMGDLMQMGGLSTPGPDWTPVRLSDIATIDVGSTAQTTFNRTNGEVAIGVTIQKEGTANTLTVTRAIEEQLKEVQGEYPHLDLYVSMNQGEFIELAIKSVTQSLIAGAVLAAIILLLFLRNLRATLTVGIAIPFSVIVTFVLIYFQGLTVNIMTLGGLALGVGMLVDNSIVVIENIYRRRSELGEPPKEAAERGAKEVAAAITTATLTTIAVFLPVVYVGGLTGELFRELALTVTYSLLASLLVALTVIPMLASRWLGEDVTFQEQKRPEGYLRLLRWGLGHRLALLGIVGAVFVGSLALGTQIGTEFMPTPDEGVFSVTVGMPPGTSPEVVDGVLVDIADAIRVHAPDAIITTSAGSAEGIGGLAQAASGGGAGSGSITVELIDRKLPTEEVIERVRGDVVAAAGDADVYFNIESQLASMGGGASNALQIFVSGPDAEQLREVVDQVVETLENTPGITDVTTNIEAVRPELQVRVDLAEASRLGLSPGLVGLSVSDAIQGRVAGRLLVDDRPLDIRVGLSPAGRKDAAMVSELLLQTPMGQLVPLKDVAEVVEDLGPLSITRQNQRPTVQVNALISGTDLGTATFDAMAAIERMDLPAGYTASVGGASELMSDSLGSLSVALVTALLLIYMIMASLFESLRHPFIIMFTIPLALTGVVIGLVTTGHSIGVTAMIGFIILAGIVINNGIIMVDFINQRRAEGMPVEEAILEAGRARLRPILMTALTTMLGLVPMALGLGEGAEIMAPMAISVIGGLLTSTLLTLVVIPVIYRLVNREKGDEKESPSVQHVQ